MNYDFDIHSKMGNTPEEEFTMTWFYRALAASDKTEAQRQIDLGDRFISLWICFNSIIRELEGENLSDKKLIDKSSVNPVWTTLFENNKNELDPYLIELMSYNVTNMKDNTVKRLQNKNFSELINIIYQVRCNLFHGRKNPYDFEGSNDYKLIRLSFLILSDLVMKYLTSKKLISLCYSENYYNIAKQDPNIPEPIFDINDFEDGLSFIF